MKNVFVTFEGIDFSGKSTQAKLLAEKLTEKGEQVLLLRDPGATAISERIRSILLDKQNLEMSAWTELLLYEAARAQMVKEMIEPALQEGKTVICDRFYDSTTAYQGYARGIDLEIIDRANSIGSCGITPHVTYLIDLESAVAENRKGGSHEDDRMEAEGVAFQEKVRQGFLRIAEKQERVVLVDGNRPLEAIQNEILADFKRFY